LIRTLRKFKDSQFRIEEEKMRARGAAIELVRFLHRNSINNVKDVDWIGRYHQTRRTLSDVDLILTNNEIIGISLKSTRIGLGTQKNLGYRSVKNYLLLDIDNEIKDMWKRVRSNLQKRGGNLKLLANASKNIIKDNKRKYPIIEKIGKKYGYVVQ